jgi:HEPN domain-containing protein
MAEQTLSDARLFRRCALQRFRESEVLFEAGYTTGAVYLAGYGVECILKALVSLVNDWSTDLRYNPRSVRSDEAEEFLGSAAAIIRWAEGRL